MRRLLNLDQVLRVKVCVLKHDVNVGIADPPGVVPRVRTILISDRWTVSTHQASSKDQGGCFIRIALEGVRGRNVELLCGDH